MEFPVAGAALFGGEARSARKTSFLLCPSEKSVPPVASKEDPPQRHRGTEKQVKKRYLFFLLLRASVSLW
jgi:hypothetical protein